LCDAQVSGKADLSVSQLSTYPDQQSIRSGAPDSRENSEQMLDALSGNRAADMK
jgi:hypothetical protein